MSLKQAIKQPFQAIKRAVDNRGLPPIPDNIERIIAKVDRHENLTPAEEHTLHEWEDRALFTRD